MVYAQNFAPAYSAQDIQPSNGRIDLMSQAPSLAIPQYQPSDRDNGSFVNEATTGQIAASPLSELFFSKCNMDALQQGIRYKVWVETDGKHVIGRQSDNELKIVMRSIFYQYAKHDKRPLVEQVRELNAYVLAWSVPEVLSNLQQYEAYRRDASTLPMPLERAQLSTTKGTKVLEIKSFM